MSDVTFTWKFLHWEFAPKLGEFTDVITKLNWQLTAEQDGYSTTAFGSFDVPPPMKGNEFISKAELLSDPIALQAWCVAQAEASPRVNFPALAERMKLNVAALKPAQTTFCESPFSQMVPVTGSPPDKPTV